MGEGMRKRLNDSLAIRWGVLLIVSLTMLAAYYVNDVVAPLKSMLEAELGWQSSEFGFYTGSYSFLNVFFPMLIWGGLILDRFGIRFTGKLSVILMVVGTGIEYFAMTALAHDGTVVFGFKSSVLVASAGYAVFGTGAEVAGITVTKVIAKWFKDKEVATAMGVQVALSRIGSQVGFTAAIPIARSFGLTTPLLIGLLVLIVGAIAFFVFALFDKKLDKQNAAALQADGEADEEEGFSFKDVKAILRNPGFWLIALLCVLFYSGVIPFQKFASEFMMSKYGIDENLAGFIAGLPALGTLILTPVFGGIIDKKGKAASIMVFGSAMLIAVHAIFALPFLDDWLVAVVLMVVLGVAYALVPSAMWPAVTKIFPISQLGTVYALVFYLQNIGLLIVPTVIGVVLDTFCVVMADGARTYDYTLPMVIFVGIGAASMAVALILRSADRKHGYGLEEPNIAADKADS